MKRAIVKKAPETKNISRRRKIDTQVEDGDDECLIAIDTNSSAENTYKNEEKKSTIKRVTKGTNVEKKTVKRRKVDNQETEVIDITDSDDDSQQVSKTKRKKGDSINRGDKVESSNRGSTNSAINDDGSSQANQVKRTEKQKKNGCCWSVPEVLADLHQVPVQVCKNFTRLLEDDCTLPFIARYRKEAVGNLEIEDLREMKAKVEELKKVQEKVSTVLTGLKKQNVLTEELNDLLSNAKDLEEVEFLCATFKDTKKRTLAGRAKELGLEELALKLLLTSEPVNIGSLVNPKVEGLDSIEAIELGIQHIIADRVGKDKENLEKMQDLIDQSWVKVCVSKSRSASKQKPENVAKFEGFFTKSFNVKEMKPHVFLAISRGEEQKILSLKFDFPEHQVASKWIRFCQQRYLKDCSKTSSSAHLKEKITMSSIKDAYSRIVEPFFERKLRSRLTETSHRASIDVFSRNLKNLLLTPPLHSTIVLGMDPGFKHGCKCAVVDASGAVLHTEAIYLYFGGKDRENQAAIRSLQNMVKQYCCTTIALGNGTACRETETFLSGLIQKGSFEPARVRYTIVNESGASIYSCSPEAREEFPNLDPNLISAVSIARRLQNPLSEYVRISPQNIGVGMYQHDVPVKKLESALDDVVSECVSFVGLDLNSCPLHMLSKVAGLTATKAKKIIDYRSKNGPFVNRQQLLDVPSIGPKTFEQCAGFLKILCDVNPSVTCKVTKSKGKRDNINKLRSHPLDQTCVHPESYELAESVIAMFGGQLEDIGKDSFVRAIKKFTSQTPLNTVASACKSSTESIEQIISSLSQSTEYDMRENFDKPLFKDSVKSMADLQVGQELTGRVTNVVDFGAFVDIGVGKDALLHVKGMHGRKDSVYVGMHITIRVLNIDTTSKRISLELVV